MHPSRNRCASADRLYIQPASLSEQKRQAYAADPLVLSRGASGSWAGSRRRSSAKTVLPRCREVLLVARTQVRPSDATEDVLPGHLPGAAPVRRLAVATLPISVVLGVSSLPRTFRAACLTRPL